MTMTEEAYVAQIGILTEATEIAGQTAWSYLNGDHWEVWVEGVGTVVSSRLSRQQALNDAEKVFDLMEERRGPL